MTRTSSIDRSRDEILLNKTPRSLAFRGAVARTSRSPRSATHVLRAGVRLVPF